MRVEFAQSLIDNYSLYSNQVFLTGDLGYMALEQVQATFGEHFINAGVAEQNMVTMAAAMAYEGFTPWVYSIAPFVTLRPYEQIRNDVCLHNLPVKLVGNGGGFGYGIMGATHHNPEDIGALRKMPNMQVIVPLVSSDVDEAVKYMLGNRNPNYMRMNMAAKLPAKIAPFTTWRKIKEGKDGVVIGTGPILENIINAEKEIRKDFETWAVSIFPFGDVPDEVVKKINATGTLVTIEEHYAAGGLSEALSLNLLGKVERKIQFAPLYAQGYISGQYGDQKWHQSENGLLGESLIKKLSQLS